MSHKFTMSDALQHPSALAAGIDTQGVQSQGHGDRGVFSSNEFISHEQLIQGCTSLVSRCHGQPLLNGLTFDMKEQVGQILDVRWVDTVWELSRPIPRGLQSCV